MTKEDVFQELLDEWGDDKAALVKKTSNSAQDYQKIRHQYDQWLKKYKEAK